MVNASSTMFIKQGTMLALDNAVVCDRSAMLRIGGIFNKAVDRINTEIMEEITRRLTGQDKDDKVHEKQYVVDNRNIPDKPLTPPNFTNDSEDDLDVEMPAMPKQCHLQPPRINITPRQPPQPTLQEKPVPKPRIMPVPTPMPRKHQNVENAKKTMMDLVKVKDQTKCLQNNGEGTVKENGDILKDKRGIKRDLDILIPVPTAKDNEVCRKCKKLDARRNKWVECESCLSWYHVSCVKLSMKCYADIQQNKIQWTCC